jgi:beta-aspartyl-peptidase (threonine type)
LRFSLFLWKFVSSSVLKCLTKNIRYLKITVMAAMLNDRRSGMAKSILMVLIIILSGISGMRVNAQESELQRAPVEMAVPGSLSDAPWTLVIHGGAGGAERGSLSAQQESQYIETLNQALQVGAKILANGGSSLDAVEAVVMLLEDSPLFNAGKGAVLNEFGKAELDASIMDGYTGMAGAVAGVTTIMNPVAAARGVMEKTDHVMLAGKGAEDFAKSMGLKEVEPSYFITPERMESWKKWKSASEAGKGKKPALKDPKGTVGAVALDSKGNLAAATSTGGLTGKMAGRIGDSPIIGAGTYANNNTCAVSATGQGEFFMRNVVAFSLSAMMQYREIPMEEAAKMLVMEQLESQKAQGGLIAVDKNGNIAMPFNTNAMFRGYMKSTGEQEVAIY